MTALGERPILCIYAKGEYNSGTYLYCFYMLCQKWFIAVELATIRTKDRAVAVERKFLKGDSNGTLLFMGLVAQLEAMHRRGRKWLPRIYKRYAETMITDEHMTSQLCVYCYFPIAHSRTSDESVFLETVRCLNPNCEAFKHGRATNNRDVMSAIAIEISAMAQALLRKPFPPFPKQ